MSLNPLIDEEALTNMEQLAAYFRSGCKPSSAFRIGTEHEKFGWYADTYARPQYQDEGIEAVLLGFEQFGWAPIEEQGTVVGMMRDGASITIEPGGQLELSGAPLQNVIETAREYDRHMLELKEISSPLGLHWSGLGVFPTGSAEDAPLMPKPRYRILEKHLRALKGAGLDMMRQTATVQVNLDYLDEDDAMEKLRLGLLLHPIIMALFANAAFVNGEWGPVSSRRSQIWETTSPLRTDLDESLYAVGARFEDYIRWSVRAPMLFIYRNGVYQDCKGLLFEDFLNEGLEEHQPTMGDYALHLSTLFPPVRLKKYLEIRGADMGGRAEVVGLAALYKGLFYSRESLDDCRCLLADLNYSDVMAASRSAARVGLSGRLKERRLLSYATDVIEIARNGLKSLEPEAEHFLSQLLDRALRRQEHAKTAKLTAAELLADTTLV